MRRTVPSLDIYELSPIRVEKQVSYEPIFNSIQFFERQTLSPTRQIARYIADISPLSKVVFHRIRRVQISGLDAKFTHFI